MPITPKTGSLFHADSQSGALICRTSWLKIAFDSELPNLRVQLLDLPLPEFLGVPPNTRVKRPCRLLLKLLLPGVDLVPMDPVRCARSATVDCSPMASRAIFAFSPASIFRPDFFIICSVYHDGTATAPTSPLVPNPVHFSSLHGMRPLMANADMDRRTDQGEHPEREKYYG